VTTWQISIVVAGVGLVSGLVGVALGHVLGSRREREAWLRAERLHAAVDFSRQITQTFGAIHDYFADPGEDAHAVAITAATELDVAATTLDLTAGAGVREATQKLFYAVRAFGDAAVAGVPLTRDDQAAMEAAIRGAHSDFREIVRTQFGVE